MKYSIVIPTYNHCDDFLKPCIESILQYSSLEDIEIIISANGCTDNTRSYVNELKYTYGSKIKLVWSDEPLGYPKATNAGIKEAVYDKIILLNNDTKLLNQTKDQWLQMLDSPFENSSCGISCVVKEFSPIINEQFAVFFCVMIDRKVFDTIGLLNEDFGTGSGEDIEFCVRAQKSGFTIHQVTENQKLNKKYYGGNFPIYHFGEGTVHDKTLVKDWDYIFVSNKFKLAKLLNENWRIMKLQNDKKIGVITPIHNDIEHIFNAVNCVKTQSIDNIIHYVYDDASNDGFEKITEISDVDNLIIFRGETKRGQSYGRNFLIEKAIADGCELIAFLDSDDIWGPDHLKQSLEAKQDNNVVYSKPIFVNESGNVVLPVNIPVPDIFVGKHLLHNNFIWISSVLADRECFIDNKFDDNLNSVEDWDMWIRLYQKEFTFVNNQNKSVRYLVRNNSQASLGKSKIDLLKQKHKMLDKLKLHLACGHDYDDSYINVDLYAPDDAVCDVRFDVQKLPYPDNSVDEIKAFHIIEHFNFFEIKDVLDEWYRVLKPGGRLYLETPDFLETCRSFVEGTSVMPIEDWRVTLYGHFFAHPWVPGQTHKFLFTENQLRTNLAWAGFKQVNRLPPASKYVMNYTVHLFLTVEAFK
jgi:GT2 family glycosyltransferase/SAM-dependent methyltransferase